MIFRRVSSLIVGLLSCVAVAQVSSAYPVERLRFTPDRTAVLDVEFGRVLNHLDFDIGLQVGYASNPLVAYKTASRQRVGSIVETRVGGSLVGGIGLFDWVQISLEVPLVIFQTGQTGIAGISNTAFPALSSTGLGDLRVVPKIRLLKSEDFGIDLAILASVYVPTSGGTNFFGDNGVIITPELAISRAVGGLRLAGNISASLLRNQTRVVNLGVGQELTLRFGASYRFQDGDKDSIPLEIGASLTSSTALENPYAIENQQSLEAKAQASWHFSQSLLAFVGGGVGLQRGWGTPDARAFLGVRFGGFAPPAAAKPIEVAKMVLDADGDGVNDDSDKCKNEKENVNNFEDADGCPDDPDTDGDGIKDSADRCPKEPEDKDEFEDTDGCVDKDDDGDGIADVDDKCRLLAEDKDGFEDSDGCFDPDNDLDGIVDTEDACALVKGIVENGGCPDIDTDGDSIVDRLDNCVKEAGSVKNNGCKEKQLVVISAGKLEILDQVYFDIGKATIQKRSFKLLDNVATIVNGHSELKLVRIEGHTDSDGDDAKNLKLSQDRCDSVKDYLVKKGVTPERLLPMGYGETKPIADNKTKAGKAKNRRVEFNLGAGAPSDIVKENK
jgi:large repetitive protein